MDSPLPVTLADVEDAADRIKSIIHHTPVLTSRALNTMARHPLSLYFKVEALQRTGSFKIRGASNAIASASPPPSAVVTHSSGNHAQALAAAAQALSIPAAIAMPSTAPRNKIAAVKETYGADVTLCQPTSAARAAAAQELMDGLGEGALFVHPSNDPAVIAGQGTLALELLRDDLPPLVGDREDTHAPPVDAMIVPVGGGGLISGCLVAAKGLHPDIKVYGAEPAAADDAHRSLAAGEILGHETEPVVTIADGLKTTLGSNTFPIISALVDGIFTVSEQEIAAATRLVWERLKIVIEPSAGVGVAVALSQQFADLAASKGISSVAIVLCGGNASLDLSALSWLQ